MDSRDIRDKLRVKITQLGSDGRINIEEKYLKVREIGTKGTVLNHLDGTGNSWWIRHDNGDIGAYISDEFEPI